MMKLFFKKKDAETDDKKSIKPEKVKPKKKKSGTSLGTKILIWFMFVAMLLSIVLPIIVSIVSTK